MSGGRGLAPATAIVLIVLGTAAPGTAADDPPRPVRFAVMADIPYRDEELELLRRDVAALPREAEFAIHLGDIKGSTVDCAEPGFAAVAEVLAAAPLRLFVLPGDNEWNDCKGLHPDEAWRLWEKHFLRFDDRRPGGFPVRRQETQPANFAFERGGVVFVGLTMVGGRVHKKKEWATRHADNLAWVREQLARHPAARAAVVFAHANRKPIKHDDFFLPFFDLVRAFGRPVMYLHGDGHEWIHEPGWEVPNLLRVQLDSGDKAPPLLVTVGDGDVATFEVPRLRRRGRRLEGPEAEALAAGSGPLRLDGILSLTVEAARAVSARRGAVALDDLVWLTPEVAAALAAHRGSLSFADLTTISAEAAAALEPHEGPLLLEGVRGLAPEAARGLGRTRGYLPLDGLADLPADVAAGFAAHRGDLSFNGLRTLAEPAARALAGNEGYLYLDGLESLDAPVARALAAHRGGLSLDGLRELSPAAAEALADHEGPLFLRGLTALPEPAGAKLRRRPGVEFRRGLE